MVEPTRLEKVLEETLRPVYGAIQLMKQEMRETLEIPDAPWKLLDKSYNELTDEEIALLMDIYHQDGEEEPCPMCVWQAHKEMELWNKDEKQGV